MGEMKSALVLSGGGAWGAYEVGVIKALADGKCPSTRHTPLDPYVFTGTSVGSFNAAMLASNRSAAELEEVWRDQVADKDDGRGNGVYRVRGNLANYLDPRAPGSPLEAFQKLFADTASLGRAAAPRLMHLLSFSTGLVERVESLVDISAFVDIDPFCHIVEKNLDCHALRNSGKVLRVVATNWKRGTAHEFNFRHMSDVDTWATIRASAAIPGLFPPVKIGAETFVDGGVVQNTPLKPAIQEGATEIHCVSLNAQMAQFPPSDFDNTIMIFGRVYTAMVSASLNEDIASARWVNEGLEAMTQAEAGHELTHEAMQQFTRVAGKIRDSLKASGKLPRPVTIHRYFPDQRLGDLFGMLDFHSTAVNALIEEGYSNAVSHNCKANGCVLVKEHAVAAGA